MTSPGVYYTTFVFEYGSEQARRADLQKVNTERPFMGDDTIAARTVAIAVGDRLEVEDALLKALRQIATMQDGEQAWWARDIANAAIAKATSLEGE